MKGVTLDSISLRGAGIVQIGQHADGHRFTLDSILLADFCRMRPRDKVLEPGAGSGVISLLLAKKFPKTTITAVELQPEAAELCRWNAHVNALQERVMVIEGDIWALRGLTAAGSFGVIVANPPYARAGTGRASPRPKRRTARQERSAPLEAWLDLERLLKNGGKYFLVYSAARAAEILSALRARKLEPKRLRLVHPFRDKPASLVLIEAVKSAGTGLEVLPPLIVHEPGGGYSTEMIEIYGMTHSERTS